MISYEELKKISRTRIAEAQILFDNEKFDGSIYLCGHAIEIALKAIICKNLRGSTQSFGHIPSTISEFKTVAEMKTHKLDELLAATGLQVEITSKPARWTAWSTLLKWNPEIRYSPIKGRLMKTSAEEVINSANKLLHFFWRQV